MIGDHQDETEENNLQEKLIMQVENISFSFMKDAVDDEICNLIKPGKSCGKLAREVWKAAVWKYKRTIKTHIWKTISNFI